MGLDWTAALLPNERPSWCSPPPALAPAAPPSAFALPAPTVSYTLAPASGGREGKGAKGEKGEKDGEKGGEGEGIGFDEHIWDDMNDEVEAAMNESDDDESVRTGGKSGNVSEDDWTDESNSVIRCVWLS